MSGILRIAWRNFWRNLGRYRLLMAALAAAVAIQVTILGAILGFTDTLRVKAARYFGGHVVVLGYGSDPRSQIRDLAQVEKALRSAAPLGAIVVRRSLYYDTDSTLFFAGNQYGQRRLIGVEWGEERPLLETLDLLTGRLPDARDESAILVSSGTAEALAVRLGDEVVVSGTTEAGQRNTAQLVVAGIFDDPSFFGFASYLSRSVVNRLLDVDPERVSEIGLFLPARSNPTRQARKVLAALAEELPVYPLFTTQEERNQAFRERDLSAPTRYGVITLDANLAEIRSLLDALVVLAVFLVVLFLLIVIIGVANTYRMIVYERTREIGTMRALGLTRASAAWLFLLEALLLGLFGAGIGFAVGLGLLSGLSLMELSGHEALLIFLSQGRLVWALPAGWTLGIVATVVGASLAGCLRSAARAAALAPVAALRTE
ncbi:MAG: FtsX-like permease family protein [Spirochaetales bacterium]|nr:FtsX-like permease family protein [Spirochaetales bacterium]